MQLQPYIGYIWTKGKFFVQGFEEIEVPTDPHDVTMLYNGLRDLATTSSACQRPQGLASRRSMPTSRDPRLTSP